MFRHVTMLCNPAAFRLFRLASDLLLQLLIREPDKGFLKNTCRTSSGSVDWGITDYIRRKVRHQMG